MIKNSRLLVLSWCYTWVPGIIYSLGTMSFYEMHVLYFKKVLIVLRYNTYSANQASFWFKDAVPPSTCRIPTLVPHWTKYLNLSVPQRYLIHILYIWWTLFSAFHSCKFIQRSSFSSTISPGLCSHSNDLHKSVNKRENLNQ